MSNYVVIQIMWSPPDLGLYAVVASAVLYNTKTMQAQS